MSKRHARPPWWAVSDDEESSREPSEEPYSQARGNAFTAAQTPSPDSAGGLGADFWSMVAASLAEQAGDASAAPEQGGLDDGPAPVAPQQGGLYDGPTLDRSSLFDFDLDGLGGDGSGTLSLEEGDLTLGRQFPYGPDSDRSSGFALDPFSGATSFEHSTGGSTTGLSFGDMTELSQSFKLGNKGKFSLSSGHATTEFGDKNSFSTSLSAYGFTLGHQRSREDWSGRHRAGQYQGQLTDGLGVTTYGQDDGMLSDQVNSLSYRGIAGIQSGSGMYHNQFMETGFAGQDPSAPSTRLAWKQLQAGGMQDLEMSDLGHRQLLTTGAENMSYDADGYTLGLFETSSRDEQRSSRYHSLFTGDDATRGEYGSVQSDIQTEQSMDWLWGDSESSTSYTSTERKIGFEAEPGTAGEQALLEMAKTGLLPGALAYIEEEIPPLHQIYEAQRQELEELVATQEQPGLVDLMNPTALMTLPDRIAQKKAALDVTIDLINQAWEPHLEYGDRPVEGLEVDFVERLRSTGDEEKAEGRTSGTYGHDRRTDYTDADDEHEVLLSHSSGNYWSHFDDESLDVQTDSDQQGGLTVHTKDALGGGHDAMFEDGLSDMPEHLAGQADEMGFSTVRSTWQLDQEDLALIGDDLRSQRSLWMRLSQDVLDYWTERRAMAKDPAAYREAIGQGLADYYLKVPDPYQGGLPTRLDLGDHLSSTEAILTSFAGVMIEQDFRNLPVELQRTYVATVIHHSARSDSNPFEAIAAISLMDDRVEQAEAYHHLVLMAEASLADSDEGIDDISAVFGDFRKSLGEDAQAAMEEDFSIELYSDLLGTYRGLSDDELEIKLHLAAPWPDKFLTALRVAEERGIARALIQRAQPDPVRVAHGLRLNGTAAQADWMLDIARGTALASSLEAMRTPDGEFTRDSIDRFGYGVDEKTRAYTVSAQLHGLVDLDVQFAAKHDEEFVDQAVYDHEKYYKRNHERWEQLRFYLRNLVDDDPEALDHAVASGLIGAEDLQRTFHHEGRQLQDTWGQEERWEEFQEMVRHLDGAGPGVRMLSEATGEAQDPADVDLDLHNFEQTVAHLRLLRTTGQAEHIEPLLASQSIDTAQLLASAMRTQDPNAMQKRTDRLFRALRGTRHMMELIEGEVVDDALRELFDDGRQGMVYGFTRCFDVTYLKKRGSEVEALLSGRQADLVDLLDHNEGNTRVRGWMKRFPTGRAALAQHDRDRDRAPAREATSDGPEDPWSRFGRTREEEEQETTNPISEAMREIRESDWFSD